MLRGTVYQIFENDDGECVDLRRDVVSYSVETPAEFKLRALDDVQGSRLPGHEATRVEFGPIGFRWPIR